LQFNPSAFWLAGDWRGEDFNAFALSFWRFNFAVWFCGEQLSNWQGSNAPIIQPFKKTECGDSFSCGNILAPNEKNLILFGSLNQHFKVTLVLLLF
jgi:hypothetical protein